MSPDKLNTDRRERMYRIRYWQQNTIESGQWVLTGEMPHSIAVNSLNWYEQGQLIPKPLTAGDDNE